MATSLAAGRAAEPTWDLAKHLPPGYRFRPKDEELLRHYLKRKIDNESIPINISEVKLYEHNPQTLAESYLPLEENDWYFFTPRERKYKNGLRPNRAAGTGYWKATGKDKPIKDQYGTPKATLGFKKALVFHEGKPPNGIKTQWIMHEFTLNIPNEDRRGTADMKLDDWVLCKIYKKVARGNDKNKQREYDENTNVDTSVSDQSLNSAGNEVNVGGVVHVEDDYDESYPLVYNTRGLELLENYRVLGQSSSRYNRICNVPTQSQVAVDTTNGNYDCQIQSQNVVAPVNYNHDLPELPPLVDQGYNPLLGNDFNVGGLESIDYDFSYQQDYRQFGQLDDIVATSINFVNDQHENKRPKIGGCYGGSSGGQVW